VLERVLPHAVDLFDTEGIRPHLTSAESLKLASVSGWRQSSVKVKRGTMCNPLTGEEVIAHLRGVDVP
jgi:hypothetical protein